jgi:1,4-dihydroxy-2-naphthoate octaprenyltransferase
MNRSTVSLLRFPFSLFLMPVYWFALSQVEHIHWARAILIFIILHALVYPASNGYNSFMDRDQSPIGGLKQPPQPTKQLFYTTLFMDLAALVLSGWIGGYFLLGMGAYILASRAYSFRGIRLKKFPILGYLIVVIFQGGLTYYLVYRGSGGSLVPGTYGVAVLASSLLVGGFYPLTQLYQHDADLQDGIKTISYLLGYRGTFVFCLLIYSCAFAVLAYYFTSTHQGKVFLGLATCMIPILVYFLVWAAKVWKNTQEANFENTMRMNILASCCTNLGFILVLLWR